MPKKKMIFQEAGHGGDLLGFAAHYGKREEEILDFSSNINPMGPPESLIRLYHDSVEELGRYPDAGARPFVQKIAEFFSLSPEGIIAGNGSMEILSLAVRVLKPARALILEPCFNEYRNLLEKEGAQVSSLSLKPEEDFRFPLEKMVEALPGHQLLMVGHPNNPTGTALSKTEMLSLVEQARSRGVFILIDEAFADWAPEISVTEESQKGGLLVVRSMTKFFALAGIRSGFASGPEDLIRKMKEAQGPWSCNRLAQTLSIGAFEDRDFQSRSLRWLAEEKKGFRLSLESFEGFTVFPSLANFFLIQSKQPVDALADFLGGQGIYIRQVKDVRGFENSFFRAAVRMREENQRLLESLNVLSQSDFSSLRSLK